MAGGCSVCALRLRHGRLIEGEQLPSWFIDRMADCKDGLSPMSQFEGCAVIAARGRSCISVADLDHRARQCVCVRVRPCQSASAGEYTFIAGAMSDHAEQSHGRDQNGPVSSLSCACTNWMDGDHLRAGSAARSQLGTRSRDPVSTSVPSSRTGLN